MSVPLVYNIATNIPVGQFRDATDALTPLGGLDVTKMDIDLYKSDMSRTNLAITAPGGGSNDMVATANGYYDLELSASDLDTWGWALLTVDIGTVATPFVPFAIELVVGDGGAVQLVHSMPALGVLPTRDEAEYAMYQFMMNRTMIAKTITVWKADGVTPLFTLAADDAVNPTLVARAT